LLEGDKGPSLRSAKLLAIVGGQAGDDDREEKNNCRKTYEPTDMPDRVAAGHLSPRRLYYNIRAEWIGLMYFIALCCSVLKRFSFSALHDFLPKT